MNYVGIFLFLLVCNLLLKIYSIKNFINYITVKNTKLSNENKLLLTEVIHLKKEEKHYKDIKHRIFSKYYCVVCEGSGMLEGHRCVFCQGSGVGEWNGRSKYIS